MKQNRFITPEIEHDIVHLIEILAVRFGNVTWKQLEKETGYTRAGLSRNDNIKKAYDSAKSGTKQITSDAEKLDSFSVENAKLTRQLNKAKKIIEDYESKYIIWVYNAQQNGLTPEKLNIPMPESSKTTMRKSGERSKAKNDG